MTIHTDTVNFTTIDDAVKNLYSKDMKEVANKYAEVFRTYDLPEGMFFATVQLSEGNAIFMTLEKPASEFKELEGKRLKLNSKVFIKVKKDKIITWYEYRETKD